jgi:SAM-dependent methyltransferase
VFDCTTNKYDTLYARWLRKPGDLLDFAEYKPGERLLDLCGGTGAVAREAIRRGALRVALVDLNPRCREDRVQQIRGDARHLTDFWEPGTVEFDLVVCRQAVGYLDIMPVFQQVRQVLRIGGRFAFNTFRAPPRWAFKRYEHEGQRFAEVAARIGSRIVHVQYGRGMGADMTTFRWHKDEALVKALWWGDVATRLDERSGHYLCTRRA